MRWHRNLLLRSSQWWRTPGEVLIPSQSRWWSRPSPEEEKKLSANHLEFAMCISGRQFWGWWLLYHFCWDHGVLDLRAWEEVSNQEVTARLSQLASFFTYSECNRRHWSDDQSSHVGNHSIQGEYNLTHVGIRPMESKELSVLGVPAMHIQIS